MVSSEQMTTSKHPVNPLFYPNNIFFNGVRQYVQKHTSAVIVFCYLVFAAIGFSPYFLYNYILLANTDMADFNVPMFLLARRSILAGDFNFWNPYLLNGVSSLLSSVGPFYSIVNPLHWPLFFLPERYLPLAGTFLPFLNLWLIGVVTYFFFLEEIGSQKWAFFAATAYQLCGYTSWWMWTFDLSSTWLWLSVALYIIWTAHKRKAYWQYILLTLVLVILLLPSYSLTSITMLMMLGIMTLYRYLSLPQGYKHWHHLFTSISALGTSSLIFMLRILPTWFEANLTSRVQPFALDYRDLSFLGLRLFVPEVFGTDNSSSYQVMTAALPKEISDFGLHIHNYFPQFFGVIIALLILWAVAFPKKDTSFRFWFWLGYVLFILAAIMRLEPIDSVLRVLLGPIHLPMSLQVFLPVGICILAGLSADSLEKNVTNSSRIYRSLILFSAILMGIVVYTLLMWLPFYPDKVNWVRLGIIVVILFSIGIWLMYRWQPVIITKSISYLGYLALVLLMGLCLYYIFFYDHSNQAYLSHLKLISSSLLLLIALYIGILIGFKDLFKHKTYGAGLLIILVITFFLLIIVFPQVDVFRQLLLTEHYFHLAIMGVIRLMLVSLAFVTVLYLLQQDRFRKEWLFPAFFLLLIFDLLPTNKVHSFLLSTPFHKNSEIFPADQLDVKGTDDLYLDLDLKNYRVNRSSAMVKLPYVNSLYGEGNTALMTGTSVYGIRAYDGYYNGVPNRYRQFALNWGSPKVANYSHGLFTMTDERFLDLSGVRYDYDLESKAVTIRPQALSRFMLFKAYEVILDDQQALVRLKDPEFSPLEKVVLNAPLDPKRLQTEHNWGQPGDTAQKLDFIEYSTDKIELNISNESPGIVFFNDNHHPDWHVYVNGNEQTVFLADHNFMGTPVPAGKNNVIFHYQPRFFYYGLYVAGLGIALFLMISLILYIASPRVDWVSDESLIAHEPFRQRVWSHLKAFRLPYISFIFLLFLSITHVIWNYQRILDVQYKDFYIINRQDKYYTLPYNMWPMDIADSNNLHVCYQNGQCTITNSFAEAKQFVNQVEEQRKPAVVEEGYYNFNILHYGGKYYAVPQSPWLFNLLDERALNRCHALNQCAIANSLELVKQQVDSLTPLVKNKLSDWVKSINTSSTPPDFFNRDELFNWYPSEWSEFPQWIDIVFNQPVKIVGLEFQVELLPGKQTPQPITVVGGEDLENPPYKTSLSFDLDEYSNQVFANLPTPQEKYQHYRILFTNIKGQQEFPRWLTIHNLQIYVLVEEGYEGYNIYWDQNRYYIVAQDLALLDVTNLGNDCYERNQCVIAASLKEAKQLIILSDEQKKPTVVEEEYLGFSIIQYQNSYYALQLPWLFNILNEELFNLCQHQNQCFIATSLEDIKQKIAQLSPLPKDDFQNMIKSVATSSLSNPKLLFDGGFQPDDAWLSAQNSKFPQWVDVLFYEPVRLEWLGIQSQVRFGEKRLPENVSVLAGQDLKNPSYEATLDFNFEGPGKWTARQLPHDGQEKYQQYRILFTNVQGQDQTEWLLALQEMRFYVLLEENYEGFNIYWDQNRYYVVAQDLGTLDITDIGNMSDCYENGQCTIVTSLEEAKQWATTGHRP